MPCGPVPTVPSPRALDEARPHLLRRILAALPLGATAHSLSERTGLAIEATHLYELREGILDRWSDNRLWLLGERLGVRPVVTFH